jgi:hypothetical protein
VGGRCAGRASGAIASGAPTAHGSAVIQGLTLETYNRSGGVLTAISRYRQLLSVA